MAVSNNYHSENTSNVEMTNKSEMRPSLLHCRCNTDSSVDGTRRITIQQQRQHLCIHYALTTREYFSVYHQSKCKCLKLRYQTKHALTTGGRMHKFHNHNYANTHRALLSNVNYL